MLSQTVVSPMPNYYEAGIIESAEPRSTAPPNPAPSPMRASGALGDGDMGIRVGPGSQCRSSYVISVDKEIRPVPEPTSAVALIAWADFPDTAAPPG